MNDIALCPHCGLPGTHWVSAQCIEALQAKPPVLLVYPASVAPAGVPVLWVSGGLWVSGVQDGDIVLVDGAVEYDVDDFDGWAHLPAYRLVLS